jgi:protein TonB
MLLLSSPVASASEDITSNAATTPDGITRPTVIKKTCARLPYPSNSLRNREEGTVQVKVLVNKTGNPQDAIIFASSGHEALDDETLKYFLTCQYTPAIENSLPIDAWQVFEFTWRIESQRESSWKD